MVAVLVLGTFLVSTELEEISGSSRAVIHSLQAVTTYQQVGTVGTPYNTNVGVQEIPDRATWKPVVAKRNNTNPLSSPEPHILVKRDSHQLHMAK